MRARTGEERKGRPCALGIAAVQNMLDMVVCALTQGRFFWWGSSAKIVATQREPAGEPCFVCTRLSRIRGEHSYIATAVTQLPPGAARHCVAPNPGRELSSTLAFWTRDGGKRAGGFRKVYKKVTAHPLLPAPAPTRRITNSPSGRG